MNRKQANKAKSPLIRLVGLEAAVAATGIAGSLVAATALAAPGDLDPSFGDVGRQSNLGISTALWSTEVAPDGSVLASGGDCEYFSYYYSCADVNFSSKVLSTGAIAADFLAVPLENSVVFDAARQADGRLVEVGRVRLADGTEKMQVSRRLPDGMLDPGFGLNGKVWIDDYHNDSAGRSVIVDADERIVVAGTLGSSLIVTRLLPGGTLDPGFATGGKYIMQAVTFSSYQPRVVAAPGGGYRVASDTKAALTGTALVCAVTALDEAGVVDANFGESGTARAPSLPANSQPVSCSSMVIAPDGGLLLGGRQGASAYLQRLLPDGSPDPGFAGGDVNSHLSFVRAIALPTGGKIYVSGDSRSPLFGAPVLRLDSDGTLDTSYGQGGIAQVAIQANRPNYYSINDLQPGPGDTLVVGGTATSTWTYVKVPFVARLLGESGPDGPGLLSLQQQRGLATESGQEAILKVSRLGGSAGAVAVSYQSRDLTEYGANSSAAGGADYTPVTGRLTWESGDLSEREIAVPIAADTIDEQPEFFEVVLEAAEGGAGLATSGAEVEIAGSSYPGGLISMLADASIQEGAVGYLHLYRNQYSLGAVSVTVRVAGGTAVPGADFGSSRNYEWQDVVVTWPDGQAGYQGVPIYARLDDQNETSETVQFELVAATGGATLDPSASQVVVSINNRTSPSSSGGGGGGGGGNFGWLATMLLGLLGLMRRRSSW